MDAEETHPRTEIKFKMHKGEVFPLKMQYRVLMKQNSHKPKKKISEILELRSIKIREFSGGFK